MAILKSNDLVGKDFSRFEELVKEKKITYSEVRLIPQLKTKDELALTSIFLSSLRLIKEYRDKIFKEIKLTRAGKSYFFKEMCFLYFLPLGPSLIITEVILPPLFAIVIFNLSFSIV